MLSSQIQVVRVRVSRSADLTKFNPPSSDAGQVPNFKIFFILIAIYCVRRPV